MNFAVLSSDGDGQYRINIDDGEFSVVSYSLYFRTMDSKYENLNDRVNSNGNGNETRGRSVTTTWWRLALIAFPSWFHSNTRVVYLSLLATLLACSCPSILAFGVSRLSCSATNTCSDKSDNGRVIYYSIVVSIVVLIQSSTLSVADWAGWEIAARWRKALTQRFHKEYFTPDKFYKLNFMSNVDAPDQRIAEDVALFCATACGSVEPTVAGVLFGGYQSVVGMTLYTIVPMIVLYQQHLPQWQLIVIGSSILLQALLVYLSNRRLVSPVTQQEKLEGLFRYHHVAVREGAEAIAFFDGDAHENEVATSLLNNVIKNLNKLVSLKIFPKLTEHFFFFLSNIIPYAFVLVAVSNGADCMSSDTIILQITLIAEVLSSVSWFMGLGPRFATVIGVTRRVEKLADALGMLGPVKTEPTLTVSDVHVDDDKIGWTNVDVSTPSGDVLLMGVTAVVNAGQSLVIMGPSGIGKSSLLRCLAGLWPIANTGGGHVTLPSDIMFVPQTPFLMNRSLIGEVTYPDLPDSGHDVRVKEALSLCKLDYLLDRFKLDEIAPWSDMLSGGEKQRLGLARLLFHCPRFAVMDEATSALPIDMEHMLLNECTTRGITMISVAHRPSVIPHHAMVLVLSDKMTHKLMTSEQYLSENAVYAPPPTRVISSNVYDTPLQATLSVDDRPDCAPVPGAWQSVKRFLKLAIGSGALLSLSITALHPVLLLYAQQMQATVLSDITCQTSDSIDSVETSNNLRLLIQALLALVIVSVIVDITSYSANVHARKRITSCIHDSYFAERRYYRMASHVKGIDAPDQRIAADTRIACNSFFGAIVPNVSAVCFTTAGGFQCLVNMLLVTLYMNTQGTRYNTWMFNLSPWLLMVGFMIIQVICTYPIAGITKMFQQAEGAMRFVHSRSREFAESIAFYHGEGEAYAEVERLLVPLIDRQRQLALRAASSAFFTHIFYQLSATCLPVLIIYGLFGTIHVDDFSILQYEVNGMLTTLAALLVIAPQFAAFMGTIGRVTQLQSQLDRFGRINENAVCREHVISARNLDVVSPSRELLVKELTMDVLEHSGGVVITGPSGAGKSSVLRVLCGLWDHDTGVISRPTRIGNKGIFFVPQQTYIVHDASLRAQICYPIPENSVKKTPDYVFEQVLSLCKLDYLLDRFKLDEVAPWSDMLSGGEKQRLGLARLLFHCPRFAVMDEATSALPIDMEHMLLNECTTRGITMISVAHRPTVLRFHKLELNITKSGWELRELLHQ